MTARPMSEEQIDDLIDCLADAAVYHAHAENPNVSAATAMLAEARAEIRDALLSTSADAAKTDECWRRSREHNDMLRRELNATKAAVRGMREALEKIQGYCERRMSPPSYATHGKHIMAIVLAISTDTKGTTK